MGELLQLIEQELIIIIIAATPVIELRVAIPTAITLGYNPMHSMVLSIIGNMIPIPFLLMILDPVFKYFGNTRSFGGTITWIKNRTLRKSKKMGKYTLLGLFLLVAIPLPATGAWTGTIAASLFDVKFRDAFFTILAGVIVAGIIVTILSTQAISLLQILGL